ncbi:hypothetical protein C2E23DRAFT_729858, partial [Lenzites betulinus]
WCQTCLLLLDLIGPAILTTLRTYVLSGRNKLLGGVAMILSLGPFLVNASTEYQRLPVNLPPPENCAVQYSGSVAELIGMTTILNCRFLLDLYETHARLKRGGSSLSQSNIGIASFHFTGIEDPGADSPEDSPFLSSLSGPVLH